MAVSGQEDGLTADSASNDPCVFCDIVSGRAPASIIYDDDLVLAFLDIRPVTPGHLLIIPKKHATYMANMDEDTGAHLFRVSMRLAAALRASGLRCEGVNWIIADGAAASQEIFHVHLHLIPRFRGDGFGFVRSSFVYPEREELDAIAALIRAAGPGGVSS